GVILAMHYTPEATMAFHSVEAIVRDVNYGWLMRNMHASGASMFFFAVYVHMFRGLYYGSYKEPREILWILGVIIYLLMMATGFVVLHIWALHVAGQNNPAGVEAKTEKDTVAFTPYATIKDLFGVSCFMILFAWFIFYMPNYLGDADNYIPANPGVTPAHIVPEWYYLPFYAMLRSIPNKLAGVVVMFSSILILVFLPWLDTAKTKSCTYRPLAKQF